jgi:endo-1,4-beta-xylanase
MFRANSPARFWAFGVEYGNHHHLNRLRAFTPDAVNPGAVEFTMTPSKSLPLFTLALTLTLAGSAAAPSFTGTPSLADVYADSFRVGVALNAREINGTDPHASRLIGGHFNALTAENDMKWERIHPTEGEFNFAIADALVERAESQGAFIVGHTLLWHNQTPDWVFKDSEGQPASRHLLLQRLQHHIETVVGRYRGRIHGWDVVNEALNDDGTWRDSPWRQIIGDDYVAQAFAFAHAADPDAALYYNDYNLYKAPKREAAVKLIRSLQAQGIPVGGIGIQGHYGLGYPPLDELEASIVAFSKLDIPVMFTELDISVLPFPSQGQMGADITQNFALQAELNPFVDGLDAATSQALADTYVALFRLFLKHRDSIDRVTLWNLTDASTWRNNWPVRGRTDYPVLFDRQNEPKQAYRALVELKLQHDRR